MSDEELHAWWPSLGTVLIKLRAAGHALLADRLVDAIRSAAMGSEVLGNVGLLLRAHDAQRASLDAEGKRAWDAVMVDVNGRHTPRALAYRIRRIFRP
jgi:hypothetical protein